MALRENNDYNIANDLNMVFGEPWLTISHSLAVQSDVDVDQTRNVFSKMTADTIELSLTFFIDQKLAPSSKNALGIIDDRLALMLQQVEGKFVQRIVQPFERKNTHKVSYTIRLPDFDNFTEKLHQYALTQVDKEYAEVLEAELSKD